MYLDVRYISNKYVCLYDMRVYNVQCMVNTRMHDCTQYTEYSNLYTTPRTPYSVHLIHTH